MSNDWSSEPSTLNRSSVICPNAVDTRVQVDCRLAPVAEAGDEVT